jgi:hypothetical protein
MRMADFFMTKSLGIFYQIGKRGSGKRELERVAALCTLPVRPPNSPHLVMTGSQTTVTVISQILAVALGPS